mgnify:CR=1 FL=1|tara:strand:+ start:357 stop:923 length:567 start_codon:yes stop_codon:yes gene_type:complete
MTLLTFSWTGENNTGTAAFTLTKEYKFKNLYIKDIKYNIRNDVLEELISKSTSNSGLAGVDTAITSSLAVDMDFLDEKDCVMYYLADGNTMGVALNAALQKVGMFSFGHAGQQGAVGGGSDFGSVSHSYPYRLINNRPQTWAKGKVLTFALYYRDVQSDGMIKDWKLMSATTDAFSDICDIDITLQLE